MAQDTATRRATDPKPNPVPVTITLGSAPAVNPDPQFVHLSKDEEVMWTCRDNMGQNKPFKVIFKGESPFKERIFHEGNPHSGRVRPEVRPDPNIRYLYSVIAGGGTLDPGVIVIP